LLPVLTELKEVMSDVPEKLEDGFAKTSASIGANQDSIKPSEVESQVKRENPGMNDKDVLTETAKRIREKQQQQLSSTAAKLDELISLLKGNGGSRVVVKTL
jgi:hypothetical protein